MKPDDIPVDEALRMYREAIYLGRQKGELARKRNDVVRKAEVTVGEINGLRGNQIRLGPHGQSTGVVILDVCDADGLRYYRVGEMEVRPHGTSDHPKPTVKVRLGVAFDEHPPKNTESAQTGDPSRESEVVEESAARMHGGSLYCYWTATESLADTAIEPNADQPAIDVANERLDSLGESIDAIYVAAHNATLNPRSDASGSDS